MNIPTQYNSIQYKSNNILYADRTNDTMDWNRNRMYTNRIYENRNRNDSNTMSNDRDKLNITLNTNGTNNNTMDMIRNNAMYRMSDMNTTNEIEIEIKNIEWMQIAIIIIQWMIRIRLMKIKIEMSGTNAMHANDDNTRYAMDVMNITDENPNRNQKCTVDSNRNQSHNIFDKHRKNTMYTNVNDEMDINENNAMKRNFETVMNIGIVSQNIGINWPYILYKTFRHLGDIFYIHNIGIRWPLFCENKN